MNKGFWEKLQKPIFALAPMYEITDTAFRQLIAKCGKPSVFFTEFVSVDGLCHEKSKNKLIKYLLQFEEIERPIVAQIWGNDPEKFYEAGKTLKSIGFDGIDINMGCPDKAVIKSGSGSALILTPNLAKSIVEKTKQSVGDLPVSIKTRIGYDKKITKEWISHLLETKPAAITVHGRTMKEMSKVPADWEAIGEAVQLAKGSGTLILGNGDVESFKDTMEKIETYGVDGVMIGRGILKNPWIFNKNINPSEISLDERFKLILEYTKLFEKYFSGIKNFQMVRKNIKSYTSGFPDIKELRIRLMLAKNAEEIEKIINSLK